MEISRLKFTQSNSYELYKACRFSLAVLRKLSEEGKYPEFLLSENGGHGFRIIGDALETVDGLDYHHGGDNMNIEKELNNE